MKCLLVYDIADDRARAKIADFCLDYGLDRIQFSAFVGDLARTRQEELMLRIGERLGSRPGKIQLIPVCDKDWRQCIDILQEEDDGGAE